MARIVNHLVGLGCQVEERLSIHMGGELMMRSRMDVIINDNFRKWYPMFICFNLVEGGYQLSRGEMMASLIG